MNAQMSDSPMSEKELRWISSPPAGLINALVGNLPQYWQFSATPQDELKMTRKARLLLCAAARLRYRDMRKKVYQYAVETAENLADRVSVPEQTTPILNQTRRNVVHTSRSDEEESVYILARSTCETQSVPYTLGLIYNSHVEQDRQTARVIHEIIGNPYRHVRFDPAWRTPDVVAIAAEAAIPPRRPCADCRRRTPTDPPLLCPECAVWGCDGRNLLDGETLSILADALQDAGCDNSDLINHFRNLCHLPGVVYSSRNYDPAPADNHHRRGCWALDTVLGLNPEWKI